MRTPAGSKADSSLTVTVGPRAMADSRDISMFVHIQVVGISCDWQCNVVLVLEPVVRVEVCQVWMCWSHYSCIHGRWLRKD